MAQTRRPAVPWPKLGLDPGHFARPPREFGILPFLFLNGELDPDEMRLQLREFRDKGMPGIILHGRFGLDEVGDAFQIAVDKPAGFLKATVTIGEGE